MTEKPTSKRETLVRYDSLDEMPPAEPLSDAFRALSDDEAARRAVGDPDAGAIPPDFWEKTQPVEAENKEQITLRLDREVLRYFRGAGKGYQSRINAVLKSYVEAQAKKAG
jgi:uncharacterized protein (DUF4415 family)